jgi:hypothetical protein
MDIASAGMPVEAPGPMPVAAPGPMPVAAEGVATISQGAPGPMPVAPGAMPVAAEGVATISQGAVGTMPRGAVGSIYGTKQAAEPMLAVGGPALEVEPSQQYTFGSVKLKKQAAIKGAMTKRLAIPPLLLLEKSHSDEILAKLSELDSKLYDLNNKCKKNSENLQVGGMKTRKLSRAEVAAAAAAATAAAAAGQAASKSLSNPEIATRVIEEGLKIKNGMILKINSCNTSIDSILANEAVCPSNTNEYSESTNLEGGGKRRSANTRRNKPYRFPRRFSRSHCMKKSCKKMGFTERASCRPYKNCYTRKR